MQLSAAAIDCAVNAECRNEKVTDKGWTGIYSFSALVLPPVYTLI